MYTETKINNLSIVTRGPLKAELFGVPAGSYITYVRPRINGMYSEPLEEYPIKADKYARDAWGRHFSTVEEINDRAQSGAKVHIIAATAEREIPVADQFEPEVCDTGANAADITEAIFAVCVRNIAKLVDNSGTLWAFMDAFHAEGVPYKTIFNALRKLIHNIK